ncbi:MAG: L-threonylcarbamoyladenylate synthase [Planctomycetota bacterium]
MNTKRLESVEEAAEILRRGGLVAFPTETVFGLGVDATNERAVRRLFEAKGRPSDNPLIVHLAQKNDWPLAAREVTPAAGPLLARFAPGPLTVVLPKRDEISQLVTAGLDTVGVRAPDHPTAHAILLGAGLPIAAPSANRSGRPSCTTWRSVLQDLDGRIDAVFCEDAVGCGIESTVVDCTGSAPTVLRPGGVTVEQIAAVLPHVDDPTRTAPQPDARVRSPGLAHPHYQPRARVVLVDSPEKAAGEAVAYCGIGAAPPIGANVVHNATFADVQQYAAAFYEFLREADRRGADTIFVQRAPHRGIGHALGDRQRRAAGEV